MYCTDTGAEPFVTEIVQSVQDGEEVTLDLDQNRLIVHGAPGSRMLRHIAAGHPVFVTEWNSSALDLDLEGTGTADRTGATK